MTDEMTVDELHEEIKRMQFDINLYRASLGHIAKDCIQPKECAKETLLVVDGIKEGK